MSKHTPEITLLCHEEHIPIYGNVMASGNESFDREYENTIIERLDNGDQWAWCSVEVRAKFRGLSVSAYLGGCSYRDEDDFKASCCYEDMVRTACQELADCVADLQGVEIEVPR